MNTSNRCIDIEFGVKQLGGNKDMYLKLISRLSEKFGHADDEISKLIAHQQWEEAENLVHAIKGAAGNLFVHELFDACSQLDAILKLNIEQHQNLTPKEELDQFQSALQSFVSAAKRLN